MAHERGGVTPAGTDASAEELQRLMREKREAITQTVGEIKMRMNTEYHTTKDKVTETLDWRVQMARYPLAACAGALAVGFLAGRVLGREMLEDSSPAKPRRIQGASSFGAGASLGSSSIPMGSSVQSTAGQASTAGSGNSGSAEHHEPRHWIPSAVKSKVSNRFEDVLSEVAENFFNEISKVGRDVIVPSIVASLTSAFTSGMGRQSPPRASAFSGSGTGASGVAAGGSVGSGSTSNPGSQGSSFQGRNL